MGMPFVFSPKVTFKAKICAMFFTTHLTDPNRKTSQQPQGLLTTKNYPENLKNNSKICGPFVVKSARLLLPIKALCHKIPYVTMVGYWPHQDSE